MDKVKLDFLRTGAELGKGLTLEDVQKAPSRQILALFLDMSDSVLTLVAEVESLNGRLEAVCDVVSNAAAFGDSPEAGRIMEAVRGE